MENDISIEEREYASKISKMRYAGELEKAVTARDEAIAAFDGNNFFYKIKSDILYAMKEYKRSMDIYMEYLEKIRRNPDFFYKFFTLCSKNMLCI